MELTFTLAICIASLAPALSSPLPYVINGHDVKDSTKWPWQGSLRIKTSSDINPHTCGCALISTTEAITAAHCVHGDAPEAFDVKFGNSRGKTNDASIRSLTKIVTHEDYTAGFGYPNDIAIITFDPPVTLNTTVDTIPLSTAEQAGNTDCWITGFGFTQMSYSADTYQSLPRWLQEGNVTVYTNKECKKEWGSSINPGHVCVGDIDNRRGVGSCNGDSGGPLVCKVGGTWELVGVTSWGIAGCRVSTPSVYTRISHFTSWIENNTI